MNRPSSASRAIVSLAILLSLGLTLTLTPSPAEAWQPISSDSPTWQLPVPYSLNDRGSPDLGGFEGTLAEVRRGMDDWTRVSCTSLRSNYQGPTSANAGRYEGRSVISWTESGWSHSGSAIGVTGPRWGEDIIEADMEMNGVNFTWTTDGGSFDNVNAYSIILHEAGHYYGLGHTQVRNTSMWPAYSGGVVGLAQDDENGICSLYPGTGSDCTTTGCPSGQECVSGACEFIRGDGTVCAPCQGPDQCGGPNDFCLEYPDGAGYCGRACGSDADCDGDTCQQLSFGRHCIRVRDGQPSCAGAATPGCSRDSDCAASERCDAGRCAPRPTTGAAIGSACGMDSDCRSGLCLTGMCSQTCDWTRPTSCPGGFYCDNDVSPSCDSGFCVAGGPGAGGIGATCASDTECASAFCARGRCSEPCIPGGAVGCPAGYACQVGTLSCRGSCQISNALGDSCEMDQDCTTGICADRGEDDFCTQFCDPENPCPGRFSCVQISESASLCVPDAAGLGASCEGNDACLSGICARQGERTYCTRLCDDSTPCPSGEFNCVPTADMTVRVCEPVVTARDDGCGCRVAGRPADPSGAWWAFGGAAAAILRLRRRALRRR